MSPEPPDGQPELKRVIGLWSSVALVTGLIIGSGIFAAPSDVARYLPSAWWMLAAWILGGLLSIAGGLSAAELAVRYPKSGGQYVFIREAFGPAVAFTFGWSYILIIRPSVMAAIATVFAGYFVALFGLGQSTMKIWATLALALFTIVNCLGVREGTRTQNVFTWTKIFGLALIAGAALMFGRGEVAHFTGAFSQPFGRALPVALALGLVTILYTYDGWIDLTLVGGEVKNQAKVLPWAIILGTGITIALYILTNVAYLLLVSPAEMPQHTEIGAVALERAFGAKGKVILSTLVVVSTLGIINGALLTGVRVPYAMARDGALFRILGRVHPRTESPVNALVAQGLFAMLIVALFGNFEAIAWLFVSVAWLFYAITFMGIFVLRRRDRSSGLNPTGDDAYRMPLSPWPAVAFILTTLLIIGVQMMEQPKYLIGLALVALGLPIYWIWNRMRQGRAGG